MPITTGNVPKALMPGLTGSAALKKLGKAKAKPVGKAKPPAKGMAGDKPASGRRKDYR